MAMVLSECDALGVGYRPRIREVRTLRTPALFGPFRATICLPKGLIEQMTTEDLRRIVRHELAHMVRRDAWTISISALAQAVHWPNPLAWLVSSRVRQRCEQAADERVLRDALRAERIAYGRLLLAMAEMGGGPQPGPALGFVPFFGRHNLKGRIERITSGVQRPSRAVGALLAIAALLVASLGLTDAQEPPRAAPIMNLLSTEASVNYVWVNHFPEAPDETPAHRSIDVAKLRSEMRRRESATDFDAALMRFLC